MKRILLFAVLPVLLCSACRWQGKTIKGDGSVITENRQISGAAHIRVKSSFDVEIVQGTTNSAKVEGDGNLLSHVVVSEENGVLVIKARENNLNYSSEHGIKVYITTTKLEQVDVEGSGNVTGTGKFTGADKLELNISGSGDINLDVNTPDVRSSIAGSGSIMLTGETGNQHLSIAGSGDYKAEGLKSENTTVTIAGNGDAKVFADASLTVNIVGSGSVYYKGNASVKQQIAGSGDVKKIE